MEFNGTFLATIISFILFVILMNKLLYKPIRRIVNERTDYINNNYLSADKNNKEAEELVTERDEKITEAKDGARLKYNEIVEGYKLQKNEVIQTTRAETDESLKQEYDKLNNVSNEAKESLKWKMNELASDIAEKILGYRSEVQGFDNDSVNNILYH